MASPFRSQPWLKKLPNKLTLTRIGAVPLLLVVYPITDSLHVLCAFIYAAAAITDLLDGYIARRYDSVTPLGALLDQIADKMLVAAALVLLANAGAIPAFIAAALICRDIAVNGIRLMALEENVHIHVSDFGKWKTTLLSLAIFCLLINKELFGLPMREVGMLTLWAGLGLSLYSGWSYTSEFLAKGKKTGLS